MNARKWWVFFWGLIKKLAMVAVGIAVLFIAAVILIPENRGEQARGTAAQTQIAELSTALEAFEVDTGRYPTTAEGLEPILTNPANLEGWRGPYLPKAIGNDPWGNPFRYTSPGKHHDKGFDLESLGEDGRLGTDDDFTNYDDK